MIRFKGSSKGEKRTSLCSQTPVLDDWVSGTIHYNTKYRRGVGQSGDNIISHQGVC